MKDKINQFSLAMDKYHSNIFYQKFGLIISVTVIILQIISIINFYQACSEFKILNFIFYFIIAYLIADLLGGIVHMYMDNNTKYESMFGPFIAAFHLHHKNTQYRHKHFLKIYFYESGTKYWLVLYLLAIIWFQKKNILDININFCLVAIGILSSVAEVSHFWCHNAREKNTFIKFLQKIRVLLPREHHFVHHKTDNKNYAFLNGLTDPLINIIARYLYAGYKNNADLHAKYYKGPQTENRV